VAYGREHASVLKSIEVAGATRCQRKVSLFPRGRRECQWGLRRRLSLLSITI